MFKSQPHVDPGLRSIFDAQDPFVQRGHQVLKPRLGSHNSPEWTENNKIVGAVLLRSFPHMRDRTSKKYPQHDMKARRWLRVINLYFRLGMTEKQVAEEPSNVDWGLTPKKVKSLAYAIERAGERYLSGIPPKQRGGKRPGAGRPKTQKSFCLRIRGLRKRKIKKRNFKPLSGGKNIRNVWVFEQRVPNLS